MIACRCESMIAAHYPRRGRDRSRAERLAAFASLWISSTTSAAAHDDRYTAKVLRWYDGDTPYVEIDLGLGIVLGAQPLHVLCIDTPEINRIASRAAATIARDRAAEIAPPRSEVVITLHGRGKYGCLLAEIEVEGINVASTLFREGLADIEAYSEADRAACMARLKPP